MFSYTLLNNEKCIRKCFQSPEEKRGGRTGQEATIPGGREMMWYPWGSNSSSLGDSGE